MQIIRKKVLRKWDWGGAKENLAQMSEGKIDSLLLALGSLVQLFTDGIEQ